MPTPPTTMMVELSTITEGKMQHNEIHIPETQARTDKELETGSMVVPLPPRPPKSPDSTPKHTVVMNPHEPRIPEWPQPTAKTKMQWAPTRNTEEGLQPEPEAQTKTQQRPGSSSWTSSERTKWWQIISKSLLWRRSDDLCYTEVVLFQLHEVLTPPYRLLQAKLGLKKHQSLSMVSKCNNKA